MHLHFGSSFYKNSTVTRAWLGAILGWVTFWKVSQKLCEWGQNTEKNHVGCGAVGNLKNSLGCYKCCNQLYIVGGLWYSLYVLKLFCSLLLAPIKGESLTQITNSQSQTRTRSSMNSRFNSIIISLIHWFYHLLISINWARFGLILNFFFFNIQVILIFFFVSSYIRTTTLL